MGSRSSSAARGVSLETVLDMVRRTAGGSVNADAPLMEAGVDSLGAVELRNQLQHTIGEAVSLSSTLVFDHPTARGLIATLLQGSHPHFQLGLEAGATAASCVADVRITGHGAAYPAVASSFTCIWRMFADGYDAVIAVRRPLHVSDGCRHVSDGCWRGGVSLGVGCLTAAG